MLVIAQDNIPSWANVTVAIGTTNATKIFIYDGNRPGGIPDESIGDINVTHSQNFPTNPIYIVIGDPSGLGANPARVMTS